MGSFDDFMIGQMTERGDELRKLQAKYDELLYAVARKFPDETRHQTALRYIREAETRASNGPECAANTSSGESHGQ